MVINSCVGNLQYISLKINFFRNTSADSESFEWRLLWKRSSLDISVIQSHIWYFPPNVRDSSLQFHKYLKMLLSQNNRVKVFGEHSAKKTDRILILCTYSETFFRTLPEVVTAKCTCSMSILIFILIFKNYNWLSTTVVKGSSSISKSFDNFFSVSCWCRPLVGWMDVDGRAGSFLEKSEDTDDSFTIIEMAVWFWSWVI